MQEQPKMDRGSKGPTKQVGVDLIDQGHHGHHIIPVWFFVGIILLAYGVIIFITGIVEYPHPPATVLSNLHPAVWWGAILTVIGGIYTFKYWPRHKQTG
jgi:hypothetical protein